eukprot:TRINITY_DN4161_c0_g1_i2.p1 TRINITY_DN4161_c0_g1~~TRINITY_DN4161_c0_g1_i2.p1  ORF type:complete len:407 (+),score=80.26 TRINITY_DN4161_c0_g1_i2:424-1644(+)
MEENCQKAREAESLARAVTGLSFSSNEEFEEDIDIVTDDEEEEEQPVTLGFAQKPQNPRLLERYFFPSKAGGKPAWLDPVNIPEEESSRCDICGNPLQFLMQVYAPIEGKEYAFHRTLFVFMCPSMTCLQQDQQEQRKFQSRESKRSVKVFRCQLPRANPFYSMDPPKEEEYGPTLPVGVPLCSWCGTWKGRKVCSGCKSARYCSRQHQVDHWRKHHATECHQIQLEMSSGRNNLLTSANENVLGWPEFEIIDEEEDAEETECPGVLSSQNYLSSIVTNHTKDGDLLKEFKAFEASKDHINWASFEAHISRFPDQVLRYSRHKSAKILWPRLQGQLEARDVPKCQICNGPRQFEFQVLPQLLYFFKVENEINSLDWGTIVIYSCEASCGRTSPGYVEEFAWVQLAS